MKRLTITGICVVAVLVAAAALPVSKHLRLSLLSPSELELKRLTLPPTPDVSCAQAQRVLADTADGAPIEDSNPLSADEIAVYKAVLDGWNSNSRTRLNVSDKTAPLRDDHAPTDCECLKGIELQSIERASHSFHVLTRDVLPGKNARLVSAAAQAMIVRANEPSNSIARGKSVNAAVDEALASGLFEVSEIAFDSEHRRALVSYSFGCGSLCGSGGVWLFEKTDGSWKKSGRVCGGWIS